MTHGVEGFEHRPGHHCGSVAMADMLRHLGLDLSEPMVFGLGAGLGFSYLQSKHLSPPRQVLGHHGRLAANLAEALGLRLQAHHTDDPDEGWQGVREAIAAGQPAMVACDLSKLGYWNASTPFNGHRIVVAGVDEAAGEALVADTHFEGLQRVDLDELAAARASVAPPAMDNRHAWWTLSAPDGLPDAETIDAAVDAALATNAAQMDDDPTGVGGLDALRDFADTVLDWRELDEASWCYRFAYQCIEERGTDGAMFRYLYRDFLAEAVERRPERKSHQLVMSMTRTAQAWSTLARYLEAMARQLDPAAQPPEEDPTHHLGSMAEAVYQFESTFWDRIVLIAP